MVLGQKLELLLNWSWQERPGVSLQVLASKASSIEAHRKSLQFLAHMGTEGVNEGNCQRDIQTHFCKHSADYLICTDYVSKAPGMLLVNAASRFSSKCSQGSI